MLTRAPRSADQRQDDCIYDREKRIVADKAPGFSRTDLDAILGVLVGRGNLPKYEGAWAIVDALCDEVVRRGRAPVVNFNGRGRR